MENEIKTRSIRADNESFEKFKVISEEFPNQAQALASLISVYEVEKSKAVLPERQAEIESFTAYVQKINEIYNHSLLLNHDAEIRIRAEFERQLVSKDMIIQDLQNKAKKMELSQQVANEERNTLQREDKHSKSRIEELENELFSLQDEKIKSDNIIKSLTEITTEYKEQAKENEILKRDIAKQEKQILDLTHQNENLTASAEQHTLEIENLRAVNKESLERIGQEHEKDIKFMAEKISLEKNQEILNLKEAFNEKTTTLCEDYQKRIEELLRQREQPKDQPKKTKQAKDSSPE